MPRKAKSKLPSPARTKKLGRPEFKIDMVQLAALCRMKPTAEDCAAFFKCSVDTIERRIKEATELTFLEYREQYLVHGRFDLIRLAVQKASEGDNDMIKFCLKNLSGWSEKGEALAVNVTNTLELKVQEADLSERIELIKGK
jgi:AraC-like DNA-binding protein